MRQFLGVFISAVATLCVSSSAIGAGKTTIIDDFASRTDLSGWSAADKATIRIDGNALRIDYPQYQPGDPAGWPRATRDIATIDFTNANGVRVDIENPTEHAQFLQLGFRDANNSQGQLGYRFSPGQRRTLAVRFDEAATSGQVDWSSIGLIDLMRTQPAKPMTWKLHRLELFADQPERTVAGQMRALLEKSTAAVQQARELKLISGAFETQSAATLRRWQEAIRQPRGLVGKMELCRGELSDVYGTAKALVMAKQLDTPLVAWAVPLGTPFRPGEALLQFEKPAEGLSIHAARGQYEETQIRLTNLTNNTQELRLIARGDDLSFINAITLRRNLPVRAEDQSIVGDALVPLDASSTISVAPMQTVELWLRVDTKHHALPAGLHRANLEITDLRRGTSSALLLPIAATIRGFDLASLPQEFRVQAWAELFVGRSFVVRGNEQAAVDHLIDSGVNVLNMDPGEIPWPRLTPAGELAGPIDYRVHDETIAFLRQKGNPLILIFMNLDDNNAANWGLRNELTPGSDAWKRGLKLWLTDWAQHLRSLGLSTKDYAFYLTDEPGPEELDRYRTVGRIIREIDPSIQIYLNTAELYEDAALNDELMSVIDICQPDETVGFAADPSLLPALKKYEGKQLWVYACRTGMRSRRANAHDYYRLMAWRAMRDGLTGIGYWSYCAAINDSEDLWDGTRVSGSGAVLVYPASGGVLSSVRWELIRQAVDDTRYVQLLRHAADATTSESIRSRIGTLLGQRLNDIIGQRDNPALVVQWRIDAGQAIDDTLSKSN